MEVQSWRIGAYLLGQVLDQGVNIGTLGLLGLSADNNGPAGGPDALQRDSNSRGEESGTTAAREGELPIPGRHPASLDLSLRLTEDKGPPTPRAAAAGPSTAPKDKVIARCRAQGAAAVAPSPLSRAAMPIFVL